MWPEFKLQPREAPPLDPAPLSLHRASTGRWQWWPGLAHELCWEQQSALYNARMLDSSFSSARQARLALQLCLAGWSPPTRLPAPPQLHLQGFWTSIDSHRSSQGFWRVNEIPRLIIYQAKDPILGRVIPGTLWRMMGVHSHWREWAQYYGLKQGFPTRERALDALTLALSSDPLTGVWGLVELPRSGSRA